MVDDLITVLIPTSPIPSHPSTEIIEKTIASVRFHLPTARIYIMADGVRPNVEHRRAQYEEYLKRLADIVASMKYGWVCMPTCSEYTQQAKMTRAIIREHVTTPLVLFVEHDSLFVTTKNARDVGGMGQTLPEDCVINWKDISDLLLSGGANIVRFYPWEKIWHEHQHLMCGQMVQGDSRFIQTTQYSQWPNIGTTDFYKRILSEDIPEASITMIETPMYSRVVEAPWEKYRTVIYYPGENNRRFFHMNGRANAEGIQDPCDW